MRSQTDIAGSPEYVGCDISHHLPLRCLLRFLVPLVLCVWLLAAPAHAKYDGGSGTESAPYRIRTARQMNDIGATPGDWNKHFILVGDIDLGDLGGSAFNIIGIERLESFSGIFDGNDHEISGLDIVSTRPLYTGLFGCVGGEVKRLGLVNPYVFSQGNSVGALVGYLDQGTVTSCYAREADVSGDDNIGGLVGLNAGRIFGSYSSGNVSGDTFVGGLVGLLTDGTVTRSSSKADVTGNRNVGGLVGKTSHEISAITNSYAAGTVMADTYAGGLAGQLERGAAHICYSTGRVSGNQYVGGLIGNIRVLGSTAFCFWDTERSSQPTSAGGTGKTTAEMKSISTYTAAGWDFWDTWTICEGTNYPVLQWQIPPGDFLCPDGVDFIDFAFFAQHWHQQGCNASNFNCEGTDVNRSGSVNFSDLEIFAARWLDGGS
ncbi:MAG: GLUG motif-containing protein [Planctomycetota bacterium]